MAPKQTFSKLYWTEHPDLFSRITTVKDDNKMARCTKCTTTFNLSNMGEQALKYHMKGKEHSQKIAPVKCFFRSRKVKTLQVINLVKLKQVQPPGDRIPVSRKQTVLTSKSSSKAKTEAEVFSGT